MIINKFRKYLMSLENNIKIKNEKELLIMIYIFFGEKKRCFKIQNTKSIKKKR